MCAGPQRTARTLSCPGCRTSSKVHTQKFFAVYCSGKFLVLTKVAKSFGGPTCIIHITPCSPIRDLAIRYMDDFCVGGRLLAEISFTLTRMTGPCKFRARHALQFFRTHPSLTTLSLNRPPHYWQCTHLHTHVTQQHAPQKRSCKLLLVTTPTRPQTPGMNQNRG